MKKAITLFAAFALAGLSACGQKAEDATNAADATAADPGNVDDNAADAMDANTADDAANAAANAADGGGNVDDNAVGDGAPKP